MCEMQPMQIQQTTIASQALEQWIAQAQLYVMVDGLNQPSLAALAERKHPKVNTALYQYEIDNQYHAISPHLLRVDEEVFEWLQPVIAQDQRWGWFMRPRDRYQHWPFNALLTRLAEHFCTNSMIISATKSTNYYFAFKTRWW